MCGVVGFVGFQDEVLIRSMNEYQHHRGPDDRGYYVDSLHAVSLAMTRLSIIDVHDGHQPMGSDDGAIWIVFNGEIVNAPSLRQQLEKEGCRFKTNHSDTEVLLHLYIKYQEKMLTYLNGMFAFVIYDKTRNQLFGARDHFGIKPLYYASAPGRFAFASELKTLMLVSWIDRNVDKQSLYHYLSFQCVPSPHSIYEGVFKLAPGESFTLNIARMALVTQRYWQPSSGLLEGMSSRSSSSQLRDFIRTEFEAAVHRWMHSDVPIACSLSGGIDSSTILAIMAQKSRTPIQTYSLGFEDWPCLDERRIAKKVAEKWRTEHHEIVLRADDFLQDLHPMIQSLDEPYAGGLPSWFVFKRMAGNVKVCMTGTGGDELFGNYGKWRVYESAAAKWRQIVGRALRQPSWLKDYIKFPRGSRYPIYFHDVEKREDLFTSEGIKNREPSERLIESIWDAGHPSSMRDAVRIVDLNIQLPDEFLHMTDRFSMAFSIEARPPFLDREFAEKMMQIPASIRIDKASLKKHFVGAFSDLLPAELLTTPKKGFVLPMRAWLDGPLRPFVQYYLGREYLQQQGLFSKNLYHHIVLPHVKKQRDMSSKIWTLLMFQLWYDGSQRR